MKDFALLLIVCCILIFGSRETLQKMVAPTETMIRSEETADWTEEGTDLLAETEIEETRPQ